MPQGLGSRASIVSIFVPHMTFCSTFVESVCLRVKLGLYPRTKGACSLDVK